MKKLLALISTKILFGGTTILAAACGNTIPGAGYESCSVDTNKFSFPDIGNLIQIVVQTAIIIAGLGAFIFLVVGGFQYLTSGGDKVHAQAARDRITYAILGLVIIVAAIAVANILGSVFGVNILGNIQFPGPTKTVGS